MTNAIMNNTDILMIERDCPICLSNKFSEIFAASTFDTSKLNAFSFSSRKTPENMHLNLSICKKCSLIYANLAPDAQQLHLLYKDASFNRSVESIYAAKTYARLLRKHILSNTTKEISSLSLLDIGSGDGAFLEEVLKLGLSDISGLEPSDAPLAIANPNIRNRIIKDSFHPNQFPDNSFDIITCFQTIEHLPDPLLVAKTVYNALKPGGQFMIVCHNKNALSAKVLGMKSPIFDIEHLQLFCPTSAINLLKEANFKNCLSNIIINHYPLSYWINLLPLNHKIKKISDNICLNTGINKIAIPMIAGNILVIGTKDESN